MKTAIYTIFTSLALLIPSQSNAIKSTTHLPKETVWICDSPTAYAYHSRKSCRGLERCTHKIIEISLQEAQEHKRTPCKVCH